MADTPTNGARAATLAVKLPIVTAIFWVIKILTTGMGEAASDLLGATSLELWGDIGAALYIGAGAAGLAVALWLQLRARRYHAPRYWFAVSMVAFFGTVLADVVHFGLGLSFVVTSIVYAAVVAVLFVLWRRSAGTLSIHSIVSGSRERFYWATVLATFALGTAVGDLAAITLHLGFFFSGVLFVFAILIPLVAWWYGANAVGAFWTAYVLTRPLGASFADWFSKQPSNAGGLGFGDGPVTAVSLTLIVVLVAYVTVSGVGLHRRPALAGGTSPTGI